MNASVDIPPVPQSKTVESQSSINTLLSIFNGQSIVDEVYHIPEMAKTFLASKNPGILSFSQNCLADIGTDKNVVLPKSSGRLDMADEQLPSRFVGRRRIV